MQAEIEIRILDIDIADVTQKLAALGAQNHGAKLQRRYVYDVVPATPTKWIRLRTNGDKTELGVKEVKDATTADGIDEIEVGVDDFEKANKLLGHLGFKARSYQENRRTTFELGDVEVVIDEWPKLKPYLEIEGPTQEAVRQIAQKLGFDEDRISHKHPTEMYRDIGIEVTTVPELKLTQE